MNLKNLKQPAWMEGYSINKDLIRQLNIENKIGAPMTSVQRKILSYNEMKLKISNKLEAYISNDKEPSIVEKSEVLENTPKIQYKTKPKMKVVAIEDYTNKENKVDIEEIKALFKNKLKERGSRNLFQLSKAFRLYDKNKNFKIEFSEFDRACIELQLGLKNYELNPLFKKFDHNKSNEIDYEEFLNEMIDKMNNFRSNLVRKVFDKLDKNGNGLIEIDDFKRYEKGPKKKDGEYYDLIEFFKNNFDNNDKFSVDFEKFKKKYYINISISIEDDKYFEEVINNSWHIKNDNQ